MAAAAPESVVVVRGIVNRFRAQVVHDGLDMDVHQGEVFGVVGGSGSGKSVLLRTILGLQTPRAGSVEIEGQDLARLHGDALREVFADMVAALAESTPLAKDYLKRGSFKQWVMLLCDELYDLPGADSDDISDDMEEEGASEDSVEEEELSELTSSQEDALAAKEAKEEEESEEEEEDA